LISPQQQQQTTMIDDLLIDPSRSANLPEHIRKDMRLVDASDSHIIVGNNSPQPGLGSGSLAKFWANLIPTDDDLPGVPSNFEDMEEQTGATNAPSSSSYQVEHSNNNNNDQQTKGSGGGLAQYWQNLIPTDDEVY
jgi:hypothetical protein